MTSAPRILPRRWSNRDARSSVLPTMRALWRLEKQSGGFGCILLLAHNWANFDATKRSYELFARHVLPRFNESNIARAASLQWYTDHNQEFIGKAISAATETVQRHFAEQAAKQQLKH